MAAVVSAEAAAGLATVVAATRLGFRSGDGTTAGFATLAVFSATGLARGLLACVLAASGPGARTGGTINAQNTNSDMVAFKRFILVDRSGFRDPAMK